MILLLNYVLKHYKIDVNSKLHSYEKDVSMSETWCHKEKTFLQAYSQYIYKDCLLPEDVNVNDKCELIRAA